MTDQPASTPQTLPFQAETRQLLDLMVNALYSHKEIFLRELISNGSDALDKLRFESLKNPDLLTGETELAIELEVDKDARTLTVHDSGIGMSRAEVIENIGTIARSGTRELWEKIRPRKDAASGGTTDRAAGDLPGELIGQFGVGFYSSFMVAESVTLVTRRAGETTATRWESTGQGEYTVAETERSAPGTSVTLRLRSADEAAELEDFTDADVLGRVVKRYSDFVRYPIKLAGKTLNSMKALWKKRAGEATAEELKELYRHLSHDWNDPLETITAHAEGILEYHALLYVPARAPLDLFYPDGTAGLQLYVKDVKIMERCEELLPRYLRFVRGVVDSSDLPLNVSREILQNHGQIRHLKKGLTKKVLDSLRALRDDKAETYRAFFAQFGGLLKEGVATTEGQDQQDRLVPLLLFASSHDPDQPTTLEAYVERMKPDQADIYYLTGESREVVARSPHLEAFKARGIEVLYLTDAVDEILVQSLPELGGKKLRSVGKGQVDLGSKEEIAHAAKSRESLAEEYSGVLLRVQKKLADHVKEVRLSSRLTESPVCLVGGESDLSPQLEKLLRQTKMELPKQLRILELNPDHPVCRHMKDLYRQGSSDPRLDDFAVLLYGQALLAEGSLPPDPAEFSRLISSLMVGAAPGTARE
jgi:molecular chaperone HtpG